MKKSTENLGDKVHRIETNRVSRVILKTWTSEDETKIWVHREQARWTSPLAIAYMTVIVDMNLDPK